MKRVLFTVPNLEGGGAERVFVILLSHLSREGFEPHLALVGHRGKYLQQLPPDVVVHDLGGLPFAFVRLVRLVRRLRPDVVVSTLPFYSSLVLLLRRFCPPGVRFVVRECCLPSVHLPSKRLGRLQRLLYGFAYRNAGTVMCESPAMAADVARCGVDGGKLVVIPNPVDGAMLRRAAQEGGGNPFGPGRHVVAVGRLVYLKGMDLLLEAFAAVAAARRDVHLHILGEGPEEAALGRQAAALGIAERVTFHGFVANPFRHMAHAALLVLPSRYEGYANVPLEAMALGTPVVAFEMPGGGPVVHGVNGRLVPAGDTAGMAAAIQGVLDGPAPDREAIQASVRAHDVAAVLTQVERVLSG